MISVIHSVSHPLFLWGGSREQQLEIPHGFQQSVVVLLAPYQDGTKQGRRCNHATCSLVDLWAAFLWVWPAQPASPNFCGTFRTQDRTKVAEISLGQWLPNFFKRDPNVSLMNISRPKPKTPKKCILRA